MENTSIGNNTNKKKIRIGLPKGSFIKYSNQIVSMLIGTPIVAKKLYYENDLYEIYLTKFRDVPKLIKNNVLDYGISCDEWITEIGEKIEIVTHLDWCDTKISLIGCESLESKKGQLVTCVTEYPNIAKRFFESKQINYSIYHISGSSEAFVPNCFDYCVDCVETQETLNANGLSELEIILKSKVALVTSSNKECALDNNLLSCIKNISL